MTPVDYAHSRLSRCRGAIALPFGALMILWCQAGVCAAADAEPPAEREAAPLAVPARSPDADAVIAAEAALRDALAQDAPPKQLARALTDLGIAQWRTGDFAGAEKNLVAALLALEGEVGIASRRLIEPITYLGRTYASQGRHAEAASALKRAVAISRRAEGLFNVGQLAMLEPLIASYEALGDDQAVEQTQRYVVQVSLQKNGANDARTLAARERLGQWFEQHDDYYMAREQYLAIVAAGASESQSDLDPQVINALLGIARSHRLQFVYAPQDMETNLNQIDPLTGRPTPLRITAEVATAARPDRQGELAARRALAALESVEDPPAELMIATLMELGDWYMTSRLNETAKAYYRRAWQLVEGSSDEARLTALRSPSPLVFRQPSAAIRGKERWEGVIEPRSIELSMTVTADGAVSDVEVLSPDVPPGQVGQFRRALAQAVFRPALDGGETVTVQGYRLTGYWYEGESDSAGDPVAPSAEDPGSAG